MSGIGASYTAWHHNVGITSIPILEWEKFLTNTPGQVVIVADEAYFELC